MNMLESCAWFYSEPPEILADVLTQLVTDIRRVLIHPELGNDTKVIEMFAIVDAVAPPPPPEGARERPGTEPRARTAMTHLAVPSMTALFTRRAAQAAGEPLTARIDARTVADAADYPELRADGGTALRRDGHLVTASGLPVAAVTSVYLPGRIPSGCCRLLARTTTPLGAALEPYGVRREELSPDGQRTRGLLWLADLPVALAWELAL